MRYFLSIAEAAALVAAAQSSSSKSKNPGRGRRPAGASTGAVYMTIGNKSSAADRLTGASSDVADKLQIHEGHGSGE